MKLLKCKLCMGEVDIIDNDRSVNRKVKCRKCSSTNEAVNQGTTTEVFVIKRRPAS